MDRLGIFTLLLVILKAGIIVYITEIKTTVDIDSCNTARDRIFPNTISPAMYYENGAMDLLP